MSHVPPVGTSPDTLSPSDEDRIRGEHGLQATTPSPSTSSGAPRSITRTSSINVHHQGSSNNASTTSSPSSDRSRRRLLLTEGHEEIAPVDFAPHGFNEGASGPSAGPSSVTGYASDNLRQLVEPQQQPVQPTLSNLTNIPKPRAGSSRAISPAAWLKKECEELRKKQEELQMYSNGPSRNPERDDFPRALSMKIFSSFEPVESCIILLHNLANTEVSLESLVQVLRAKQPKSAFILLRGLQPIEPGNSGYHWADANGTVDNGFINTSRVILEDIIRDGLMAKCSFLPRDVVVLGHCQGGMAALAATACWNCIEFGGVVSFGGPMPVYVQLPSEVKAKTPALIYGVTRGDITPTALQQIQENFSYTDYYVPPGEHDTVPLSDKEIVPLLEFFAHRLGREEWKRQAVISFGKTLHCL